MCVWALHVQKILSRWSYVYLLLVRIWVILPHQQNFIAILLLVQGVLRKEESKPRYQKSKGSSWNLPLEKRETIPTSPFWLDDQLVNGLWDWVWKWVGSVFGRESQSSLKARSGPWGLAPAHLCGLTEAALQLPIQCGSSMGASLVPSASNASPSYRTWAQANPST